MRCFIALTSVILAGLSIVGCGSGQSEQANLRASAMKGASNDSKTDGMSAAKRESGDAMTEYDDSAYSDKATTSSAPADDGEPARTKHRHVDREHADRRRDSDTRRSTKRSSRIQAGTLTAGSIDDNDKFDEFRSYLSSTMQYSAANTFPTFEIGHRIVIQVNDSDGNGIGDARVTVRTIDQARQSLDAFDADRRPCIDARTGSDGRTLFLSGIDAPNGCDEFLVTVEPPQGGEPISQRVSMGQAPWTIAMPQTQARLPNRLDLALVIDTTGSMGDELEYLKVEIDSIATAIHEQFPNVSQRYALVLYRDAGDQYVTRTFDFTSALDGFRDNLAAQSADAGGDYPEAMHLALEQAEQLSWRTSETARVLFLVADAPPHARFAGRALAAVKELRRSEVTIFPVAASGIHEQAELLMREAAFLTLGQYLFLTDHSGVGIAHAKPHTPSYAVEKLNQLMIRMIATELAGRAVFPRDIIAVEEGGPRPTRNGSIVRRNRRQIRPATRDISRQAGHERRYHRVLVNSARGANRRACSASSLQSLQSPVFYSSIPVAREEGEQSVVESQTCGTSVDGAVTHRRFDASFLTAKKSGSDPKTL